MNLKYELNEFKRNKIDLKKTPNSVGGKVWVLLHIIEWIKYKGKQNTENNKKIPVGTG